MAACVSTWSEDAASRGKHRRASRPRIDCGRRGKLQRLRCCTAAHCPCVCAVALLFIGDKKLSSRSSAVTRQVEEGGGEVNKQRSSPEQRFKVQWNGLLTQVQQSGTVLLLSMMVVDRG